jgi:anti-sigma regulatory factor (Ser/Thr protein kinase)
VRSWRLELDSDECAPRLVRHSLRSWLDLVACSDDAKDDLLLLVSELVTEAIEHEARTISLRGVFDDGRLRIDVHAVDAMPTAVTDESFTDRIGSQITDNFGRRADADGIHAWAEKLC